MPFIVNIGNGRFDAARTLKSDAPGESVAWRYSRDEYWPFYTRAVHAGRYRLENGAWTTPYRDSVLAGLTRFDEFDLWYAGSNAFYPPYDQFRSLWPPYHGADYWHQMKNYQTWTISLTAVFAALSVYHSGLKWYHGAYLGLHGVEGITFNYYYQFGMRKKAYRQDKTLGAYLKRQCNKLPFVAFRLENP